MGFKVFKPFVLSLIIIFSAFPAYASVFQAGLWGGYNYTEGQYIDRIEKDFNIEVDRNLYAFGFYGLAGTDNYQLTFSFDFYNMFSYSGNEKYRYTSTGWQENAAASTSFEMNYFIMDILVGFRIVPWRNLYFGSSSGIIIGFIRPEMGGRLDPEYGDYFLIGLKAYAGYDFMLSRNSGISPSISVLWGFAEKNVTRSYTPAIAVFYRM